MTRQDSRISRGVRHVAVRPAIDGDMPSVLSLWRACAEAFERPFDPARATAIWQSLVRQGAQAFVAYSRSGAIVGAMGLLLTRTMHTGELVAFEQWWYVEPIARPAASEALLAAAEGWAQARGATGLYLGMAYGHARMKSHLRWYAQRGYRPTEVWAKKEFGSCQK